MGTAPQTEWLAPGEPVTLDNCEREPIHLPGRVQAHGALIVVDLDDDCRVVQASANAAEVLGTGSPTGRPLAEVIGTDAVERVMEMPWTGPPAVRPETLELYGGTVMVQCFEPATGLMGIDLERSPEHPPDGAEISRYTGEVAARLAATTDEDGCLAVAIRLLKDLTGFDRVWAYRFESDGHGVVVAEERDDSLDPFLGLHFPEADIPAQARALYVTAGVRLIGDSQADDVPLEPEINPVTGERTDLSGSDLRGVSPMHVRYLRNMGVRTSMSVPIVIDGELWGLLSAHHYARPHRVSALTRSQCETLGTLASMQLSAVNRSAAAAQEAYAQRHLRDVAAHLGTAATTAEGLLADPAALRGACDADGVLVALGDGVVADGLTLSPTEIETLLGALSEASDEDVVVTDQLTTVRSDLTALSPGVAGVLAICLSRVHRHWVVWTRTEQVEQTTWANRDRELVRRDPSGAMELGARESFERWGMTVKGKSLPWGDAHVAAAREVRAVIGAHALHQAQQLSQRAAELARVNEELDAFAYSAAHDLRQPVRAIAMRTDFLLEDAAERLTADERESVGAILRLTGHMGGLVDSLLEYAKLDYAAHQTERVELSAVLADVRDLLGSVAEQATITQDDATVTADPDALRQILFNLVWNAIKYTERPPVIHIGATTLSQVPPSVRRPAPLLDTAEHDPDVVYVRDNGIGIDGEHLESIFGLFRRLHTGEQFGDGSGAGLALCRRLVQRSGGAIWATSKPGTGSTFYLTTSGATV